MKRIDSIDVAMINKIFFARLHKRDMRDYAHVTHTSRHHTNRHT